jgi:hypothetical protein
MYAPKVKLSLRIWGVLCAFDGMLSIVDKRNWKGARRKINLMKYIARRNADAEWKIGPNGYPSAQVG